MKKAKSEVLKALRERKGWTQQEVAHRLGTTKLTIGRWETGRMIPHLYFRRLLCDLFETTEEAIGWKNDAPLDTMDLSQRAIRAVYDPYTPLSLAIPLIGRKHSLDRIVNALCSGAHITITAALNGLPGVGKTALAIALAHDPRVSAHFTGGVLWAALGPAPNPSAILSRWASLLGVSEARIGQLMHIEEWMQEIRAAIGTRSILIVIDDAWTLEDTVALHVGGPCCSYVLTTRFPAIAAHLDTSGALVVEELDEAASLSLLSLLAPQAVMREETKIRELIQAVGGLPLALTLIGNLLRTRTYRGPSRRLAEELEALRSAETRLQLHQPLASVDSHPSLTQQTISLHSIIAVTDALLDRSTRRAFYALSVFPAKPHSFSEEMALAVADCSLVELDNLIAAGLLECTGDNRYRFHQVIADYATLHLYQDETAYAQTTTRLIISVMEGVEAHAKHYDYLEQESIIIDSAIEKASADKMQMQLSRIVEVFASFLIMRSLYDQAQRYLTSVQETEPSGFLLLYKGTILERQGDFVLAQACYERGIASARSGGDDTRLSTYLHRIGHLLWKMGAGVQSKAYVEEGLAIARARGDEHPLSNCLYTLGIIEGEQGNHEQSHRYYQEALTLGRQRADQVQICSILLNLGVSTMHRNIEQAEATLLEAFTIARQIGFLEAACVALVNRGEIRRFCKDFHQAETFFEEGLRLAQQIEQKEWTSVLFALLAALATQRGALQEAEQFLQQSWVLARQINRPRVTSFVWSESGNLALAKHDIAAAIQAFEEMSRSAAASDLEMHAFVQFGRARIAAAQQNRTQAQHLGEKSLAMLKATDNYQATEVQEWLQSIEHEKAWDK